MRCCDIGESGRCGREETRDTGLTCQLRCHWLVVSLSQWQYRYPVPSSNFPMNPSTGPSHSHSLNSGQKAPSASRPAASSRVESFEIWLSHPIRRMALGARTILWHSNLQSLPRLYCR